MVYLVLRVKGLVNVSHWGEKTMKNLNLERKFNATLVPENDQTLGMLRKVKDIVTWSSVADPSIIKELLEKRGKKTGDKNISPTDFPEGYKTFDEVANGIHNGVIKLTDITEIKPRFALTPPKGGFKRKTKKQYSQQGILGENKDLIELIKRMI